VSSVVEREGMGFPGLLRMRDGETFGIPGEWKTRVGVLPNCVELQSKLKELETKMKELEKKLQK
jgi:hypothetical protein